MITNVNLMCVLFRDCQILDFSTLTWTEGPRLINSTAYGESSKVGNKFYIRGGSYPSNPKPGPTTWIDHDIVQVDDMTGVTNANMN